MEKDKITLGAVKQDLIKIAKHQLFNKADWRFTYIVPSTLAAILVCVSFKSVVCGPLLFLLSAYHLVRYVMEYKEYREKKASIMNLIERGEISVSTEIFSHIARERIYEPHMGVKRARSTKLVRKYYFESGVSWRVPYFAKYYSWSQDFYTTTTGLENMSIKGDEFFYIRLQEHQEIAHIYPCKIFELDASLKNK